MWEEGPPVRSAPGEAREFKEVAGSWVQWCFPELPESYDKQRAEMKTKRVFSSSLL